MTFAELAGSRRSIRRYEAGKPVPEKVIIARTYADAGADVLFFEAPQSAEEVRSIAGELKIPLLANMVENGKTPLFSRDGLIEMDYNYVDFPTFNNLVGLAEQRDLENSFSR